MKTVSASSKIASNFFDLSNKRFMITRAFKRKVRSILRDGPLSFLRNHYAGLGSCLLYHRVSPDKAPFDAFSPYSGLTVTKEVFDLQCHFLKKNYNCLPLPEAVEKLYKGELGPKTAIITFDDGYKDNLEAALPVLEKYELPATIYVTSGLVDRTAEMWWFEQEAIIKNSSKLDFIWRGETFKVPLYSKEEKFSAIIKFNKLFKTLTLRDQLDFMKVMRANYGKAFSLESEILTWDEVRLLDRHPLITIGAHTKSHAMLSKLEADELQAELTESKARLEKKLGHTVDHLAYPFGARGEVGTREFEAAKECGYKSAVTTRQGHLYSQHAEHLHILPRISINNDDLLDSLTWKLSGLYSMFHHRGKRLVLS